jgi:hypothetical protein
MQTTRPHSTLKKDIGVSARMLKSRYRELAYCRLMTQRARALGDKGREHIFQADAERARRCIETLRHPTRKVGVVVYPGMRAELDLWVRLSLTRPNAVVDAPRKAAGGPKPSVGGLRAVYCARCESVGHEVDTCPFDLADASVLGIARLRRERRMREVA